MPLRLAFKLHVINFYHLKALAGQLQAKKRIKVKI
jgi:hypothetical protein